ncbi:hypothetical protein D3C75_675330 [compost metagenome]
MGQKIDSLHKLPVTQPSAAFKSEIPTRDSVRLCNDPLLPKLPGNTRHLLDGQMLIRLFTQSINSGNIEVAVVGHNGSSCFSCPNKTCFRMEVSRKFQAILPAPGTDLLCVGFAEQFSDCSPIIKPGFIEPFTRIDQQRQYIPEGVAVLLQKISRKHIRPANPIQPVSRTLSKSGNRRLIRKYSRDGFAELLTDFLLV